MNVQLTGMMDLTRPIARSGEPIYASIIRNRSGQSSGQIDYGIRNSAIENLSDGDKQDIVDTAYAMYCSIRDTTGRRAKRDEEGSACIVYGNEDWLEEHTQDEALAELVKFNPMHTEVVLVKALSLLAAEVALAAKMATSNASKGLLEKGVNLGMGEFIVFVPDHMLADD